MLSYLKSRFLFNKRRVHISAFLTVLTVFILLPGFSYIKGQVVEADSVQAPVLVYEEGEESALIAQGNTLRPICPLPKEEKIETKVENRILVYITAYSSTTWQTDSTPFITAAGTPVRNGVVATNLLPFGAKIKIPQVYGDKIFVVEDRMHPKNSDKVDIWFPTYWQAKNFGVKKAHIEVLR